MKKSNFFKFVFEFTLILLIGYILNILCFKLQPCLKTFIWLLIIVCVSIYFVNYYLIKEDGDYSHIRKMILFYSIVYFIVLLLATSVFRGQNIIIANPGSNVINLIPILNTVEDIKVILSSKNIWLLNSILCNFVMFVPFGYFIPRTGKNINFKKTIILAFILSGMIEVFQYVFSTGVFDIDDIMLNVLGVIIFFPLLNKSLVSKIIDKFILFKTTNYSIKDYLEFGVIMFILLLLVNFLISSYWKIV